MQKFSVTAVEIANTVTGETFQVPGMRVTLAQLRVMVANGRAGYTANVLCDDCGDSVADCPKTAHRIDAPLSWSAATVLRHREGLVTFA